MDYKYLSNLMKNDKKEIVKIYDETGKLIFKKNSNAFWVEFQYKKNKLSGYKTSDGIIWNYK